MDIEELIRIANNGDPYAQFQLGRCYEYGRGVEINEVVAFEWYSKSAEQNYATGQAYLGECYEYGVGVEKDSYKAVELYMLSAAQGNPYGQAFLGSCYECGPVMFQDIEKAVELYKLSAEQDNEIGYCYLGSCFELGTGVEQNMKKAVLCYKLSYAKRDYTFKEDLVRVIDHCTFKDLTEIKEISLTYDSEEDKQYIEEKLQSYKKKSHNYEKVLRLVMDETICSICYEEIKNVNIYLSKCLHYFHHDCVCELETCPLCRSVLTEINL